jgi:hypothetical protein
MIKNIGIELIIFYIENVFLSIFFCGAAATQKKIGASNMQISQGTKFFLLSGSDTEKIGASNESALRETNFFLWSVRDTERNWSE